MHLRAFSFASLLLFSTCHFAAAQAAAKNAPDQTTVMHASTREVLLDVVVRDKHHHTVPDLKQTEIEIYEDGVKQTVRVFRNVQGLEELLREQAEASNASANAAAAKRNAELAHPLNTMRQVNFVSVVFGSIAPLDLEFARHAVQEFLKSDNLPNTYVTIYRLGHSLSLMQPYTSDKEVLAKAVDAAAKGVNGSDLGLQSDVNGSIYTSLQAIFANVASDPNSGPGTVQAMQNILLNPIPTIVNDPLFTANAAAQDVSFTLGEALVTQAHLANGLRMAASLSDGMDAMDALHELVRAQAKLPGRKVVLLLSDGLGLPADRRDVVDHLISTANRVGVSFYTVDTRGLSPEDPMMAGLASQRRAAAESAAAHSSPALSHREDDDVALAAVSNTQLAMREIAESTGGFSVDNTNEIAGPMQHVMEDIRTHYELAYSPTSTKFDGHFRKIEVRVSRPKVTVQTRKGYFALPELNGEPVQPFEMVALNAINAQPAPAELPYQVALIKLQPMLASVEYDVAFEVPVSGLRVVSNAKTGKARIHASVVALIHNADGEIIGRVSRDLAREVPTGDIKLLSDDRILYAEPIALPAGHYVIDTAVTDEQAEKTGVKRVSVFVNPTKDFGLSSVEVVGRVEPLVGPRNPMNPFELEKSRITPTFVESVASGKPVGVYFVVYPAANGMTENPKVVLQMYHDGKEVARKPLDLPSPEANGSIPVMLQLAPEAGQCDIVVTAKQGTLMAESSLSVRVQ